ncbi:MAG: spermidine synthase [Chloroflexi bacterium]|nr:spermidine synthase [Chloroflexota bacterium]
MPEPGRGVGLTGEWLSEAITPSLVQMSRVRQTVYSGTTAFQDVQILDTVPFGRVLVLDGKTQSSEADEYVYHEALVHPALLCHPSPQRVFVGGGGEGATLREVLNHRSIEQVVMIDLDGEVVNLCKQYFGPWHQGSFDDSRVQLRHEDAYGFLERENKLFDALILDLVDPMESGPAFRLYTREFYEMASSRLSAHGSIAIQSGPAIAGMIRPRDTDSGPAEPGTLTDVSRGFTALMRTLREVFPLVIGYVAHVPSLGGPWSFVLASKGTEDPAAWSAVDVDRLIASRILREPRYYDGVTHRGMFSLPKPLRKAIAAETWVVTEQNPLDVS